MSYLLILTASILLSTVIFGVFIPWCFRLIGLYWAHSVRDRVYAVGNQYPEYRESLLYRDAEWISCTVINALRRKDSSLVMELAKMAAVSKERAVDSGITWRGKRYDYEIEAIFSEGKGYEAFSELIDCVVELDKSLFLRSLTFRPSTLFLALVIVPVVVVRRLPRKAQLKETRRKAIAIADRLVGPPGKLATAA